MTTVKINNIKNIIVNIKFNLLSVIHHRFFKAYILIYKRSLSPRHNSKRCHCSFKAWRGGDNCLTEYKSFENLSYAQSIALASYRLLLN